MQVAALVARAMALLIIGPGRDLDSARALSLKREREDKGKARGKASKVVVSDDSDTM